MSSKDELRGGQQGLQRVIRQSELPAYCGLRRSRIDELIAAGKFPHPVKLSERRKGWLESELIAWQRQRVVERDRSTEPAK